MTKNEARHEISLLSGGTIIAVFREAGKPIEATYKAIDEALDKLYAAVEKIDTTNMKYWNEIVNAAFAAGV